MAMFIPQVEQSTVPLQRFDAPEAKNFAPAQQTEQGQAVVNAGNTVTKIALEFENDVAEAATRERVNQLSSAYDDLLSHPETGYLAKSSKAAVDGYGDVVKEVDSISEKIGEGATTDLERTMYKKFADKYRMDAKQKASSHALNQSKVWNVTEATTGVENLANKIGKSYMYVGTPEFTKLTAEFDAKFKDLARVSGIPEGSEPYKAAERKYRSEYNHQVISGMIQTPGFTEKAKEYYYQNKENIDDPKGDLLHRINAADDDLIGDRAVDTAWKSVMGDSKDYNAPVKSAELLDALRKDPALDSKERRQAAEQKLHLRVNAWDKQQAELNQAGENTAWSLLNSGKTLTQIKSTPAWSQMGGEAQGRFQNTFENIQAARAQRRAAEASRDLTQMQVADKLLFRKNSSSYFVDSDPARLSRMSRGEIIGKQALYGQEATEHLLNKWESLQKREEGLEVISTGNIIKVSAQQAGIIPKTAKPSDEQQDAFNRLELEVAKRVKLFEQTKLEGRRKATGQELQGVVDSVLLDKAKVSGTFTDTEKPISLMTKDEVQRAKVNVNGQDIFLARIPAEARTRYITKLGAAGIAATERRVAELYLADNPPKPKDKHPDSGMHSELF